MNSLLRLLALAIFGAAGVGIAVCVAMSLDAGPHSDAAAPESPRFELPKIEVTLNEPSEATHPAAPLWVAPEPAYAEQFQEPPTTQTSLPGGVPAMNDLNEFGRALLEQLRNQTTEQSNAASGSPSASVPPPPTPDGEEDDEESDGESTFSAPTRSTTPAPSSFKVSKLPGEGDDRLSVHIQNKDLREVLDFLGEHGGLSILASNSVQGKVSVSLTDVTIEQALAAILKSTGYVARREGKFVYVGTLKDIESAAQSIDRIGTRIYRPNYVKAADLQPIILPLLSAAGSVNGASSVGKVAVSPPAQTGIAADSSQTGGDSFSQGEVLVVRDYEAVLAEIDQVVAEIDQRPMQVAIEAMLLSVELKDSNSFGVDFLFLRDRNHIRIATGSPLSDLGQMTFTNGGLKLGFLDSSLGAFLSALQTIGDTDVIATPRLMCLNKQRAEILIGSQFGYVTKTLTQTTTTQSVEFLQVGTQLRIRPFISTDGLIRMEVHPEISTGNVEVKEGFTLPNKNVTQVTTQIMVRDGCTVVIGGLMQETLATTGSQVPLIGSTPGIGFLFRNRKNDQTRSEIIVLITPHIVYEPESCIEGDRGAADFHRQHAVYRDQQAPLNSRTVARRFFRQAQDAWAKGDQKAALHWINLAIHFDPMNRASIDLRSDIMAGNHVGFQSGLLGVSDPSQAMDGEEIAPWVLDELEHGAAVGPHPHPRDPGAPTKAYRVQRVGEWE